MARTPSRLAARFTPRSPSLFVLALVALTPAAQAAPQVAFLDRAVETGTDHTGPGRGAAMVDLDGDGLLDLVAIQDELEDRIFRQLPDHTFEDVSAAWGLPADEVAGWGVVAADFDNDGDPDLYVPTGGFVGAATNILYRNDLDTTGQLTDVSASSGDADLFVSSFGATALDYDRDGWLDLFVSNNAGETCTLLRNEGGLVFTDVSVAAGIVQAGEFRHCSAGDVDNDGWLDVAVGNFAGVQRLYRNNGDGTFTDIALSAGVAGPTTKSKGFGFVLEDFDNDGWMDLYLPKYQQTVLGPSRLYLNNRDLTFRDVTAIAGMTGQTDMGHSTHDVDADGYPDIYIGTGSPPLAFLDTLYLVTPDGTGEVVLTDASASSGIQDAGLTRCHGMAFGDYDEDGDVDVYTNTGGPGRQPSTWEVNNLWQSQGTPNGWLKVELTGVLSNRSAVGARAALGVTGGRTVHRFLSAGKGFANTDSPILHFGLGAELPKRLDVTWPSGIEQVLLDPAASTTHELIETGMLLEGTPSIGSTTDLVFAGPPLERFELVLGFTAFPVPLPEFGGILYVLPPVFPIFSGQLDAAGRATLPFVLPDDPTLVGAEIYFQSWFHPDGVFSGGTLSNLVTMNIE